MVVSMRNWLLKWHRTKNSHSDITKGDRLAFSCAHENWTFEDWNNVILVGQVIIQNW